MEANSFSAGTSFGDRLSSAASLDIGNDDASTENLASSLYESQALDSELFSHVSASASLTECSHSIDANGTSFRGSQQEDMAQRSSRNMHMHTSQPFHSSLQHSDPVINDIGVAESPSVALLRPPSSMSFQSVHGKWEQGWRLDSSEPLSTVLAMLLYFFNYTFCWVFHNPYCAVLFRCGCTWNWQGGWDHCNVHNPNTPNCPWCAASKAVVWLTDDRFISSVMTGLAISAVCLLEGRKRKKQASGSRPDSTDFSPSRQIITAIITAVLTFLIGNMISGLLFWRFTDYPYFLFWTK